MSASDIKVFLGNPPFALVTNNGIECDVELLENTPTAKFAVEAFKKLFFRKVEKQMNIFHHDVENGVFYIGNDFAVSSCWNKNDSLGNNLRIERHVAWKQILIHTNGTYSVVGEKIVKIGPLLFWFRKYMRNMSFEAARKKCIGENKQGKQT